MKTRQFENIPNSDLCKYIDEWVKSDRNRSIMKRRYIDGICFEKLAEEYKLSIRQVKNIVKVHSDEITLKLHQNCTFISC